MSIKNITRSERVGRRRPIRKQITGPLVPFSQVLDKYISLDGNKADLTEVMSEEILESSNQLPDKSTVVAGGGCYSDINAI